jgi:hypothetical protein
MLSLLLVARKIFASSSPQAKIHRPKAPAVEWSARLFFSRKFLRFQRVLEFRSCLLRERGRDLQLLEQRENELLQGGHRQLITIGTGRNGGSRSLLDPRENELLQQGGALVSY